MVLSVTVSHHSSCPLPGFVVQQLNQNSHKIHKDTHYAMWSFVTFVTSCVSSTSSYCTKLDAYMSSPASVPKLRGRPSLYKNLNCQSVNKESTSTIIQFCTCTGILFRITVLWVKNCYVKALSWQKHWDLCHEIQNAATRLTKTLLCSVSGVSGTW